MQTFTSSTKIVPAEALLDQNDRAESERSGPVSDFVHPGHTSDLFVQISDTLQGLGESNPLQSSQRTITNVLGTVSNGMNDE